LYNGVEKTDSH